MTKGTSDDVGSVRVFVKLKHVHRVSEHPQSCDEDEHELKNVIDGLLDQTNVE